MNSDALNVCADATKFHQPKTNAKKSVCTPYCALKCLPKNANSYHFVFFRDDKQYIGGFKG